MQCGETTRRVKWSSMTDNRFDRVRPVENGHDTRHVTDVPLIGAEKNAANA